MEVRSRKIERRRECRTHSHTSFRFRRVRGMYYNRLPHSSTQTCSNNDVRTTPHGHPTPDSRLPTSVFRLPSSDFGLLTSTSKIHEISAADAPQTCYCCEDSKKIGSLILKNGKVYPPVKLAALVRIVVMLA